MKPSICLLLICMHFFALNAFAEDDPYKSQANALIDKTEWLDTFLKVTPLDFELYSKWYGSFTEMNDRFKKAYMKTFKDRESFTLMQEASELLSSAWTLLKQAQYSEDQYKESITLQQVAYAHSWKETATEQQKKAFDTFTNSRGIFKRVRSVLKTESPVAVPYTAESDNIR